MKKIYSLFTAAAMMLSAGLWGQNLASWDAPNNGTVWLDTLAPTTVANNITVSSINRGGGLGSNATPAGYSFGGSGVDKTTKEAAIEDGDYFEFSIKANEGYKFTLTGIPTWFIRRSGSSGTCNVVTQFSVDGGTTYYDIADNKVTSTSAPGADYPVTLDNLSEEQANLLKDIDASKTLKIRFVVYSSQSRNIYIVTGNSSNQTNRLVIAGTVAEDVVPCSVVINSQPSNQTVDLSTNTTATFEVEATGSGDLTYQWQVKANAEASWTDIVGATGSSYTTPTLTLDDNGALYRVIVTSDSDCSEISEEATLTVFDPTLAVSDANNKKVNLVKNTVVSNEIIFGANAKVSIYNNAGQLVKVAEVKENASLDVSSLAKGNYIVSAVVNGKTVSQKIIKK